MSSPPKFPDPATWSYDEYRKFSFHDYMEFLRVPYEKVAPAFNNFADENLIAQGTSAMVYKGQVIKSGDLINVVARKYSNMVGFGASEMVASYFLNHKYTNASVLNYIEPDENNDSVIIVTKHEANGSLDKHLTGSTLTWMQRLKICVGVADALSYIHYGLAFDEHGCVIHSNLYPSKILLDDNWEPKLSGFGHCKKLIDWHHLHLTKDYNCNKLQYMDPAYEQTNGITVKSDVFSFGVVLFEVLFGMEASIKDDDQWYFARLARLHYEEKTLDGMIDPDLRKQMDLQSLKIFSEIAYFCLREERKQRPDSKHVLKTLHTAPELQQKYEHSTAGLELSTSDLLKGKNLDHLRIRLIDIESATNQFSEEHCIGSGGYGKVYKAKLDHFDSTVAIKRIFSRVDNQAEEGFLREIEMLSNCKHENIVSLLGFCIEGPEMILVYELVSNGSLDDYFGNTDKITNFSWSQRLQISLDIAHGLNYLHTSTKDKPTIIHRDIKSANILLDDEWVAKIGDFGLSKLHQGNQSTLVTQHIAGTDLYLDPEYLNTGKLKKKSDIYSFGVVLFELLFGRLAYDNIYKVNNETGLPSVARRCFNEGTLGKMVDPKLVEVDENILMLNEGLNQDSLHTFSKIAYQCLSETQAARPTMDTVIEELEKALNFHNKSKENLQISLRDLKLATQNFNDEKCIGEGRYWKQYKGEISHSNADGPEVVVVKRWDSKSSERHQQFLTELKILFEYKHRNIVSLVGYCNEMDERIIVHEYASNGSLEKYVKDFSILTWMERLKICLDIANVVCHLHFGGRHKLDRVRKYVVVHRDIKTSSILLDADWQVKVSNFELCSLTTNDGDNEHVYYNTYGSLAYVSEDYKDGYLTQKSDVYSLGVILWEMITGRLAWEDGCTESLASLVTRHYCEQGKHVDELIPKDVMKQGALKSLTTFLLIATKCLYNEANSRPFALDVVIELNKALAIHEDEKIWKFMLPGNYKDIIKLSKTPEIYSDKTYQELYGMFVEGVLIQEDKLLLSISNIPGEMNIMVSSATFSHKNRKSHKSQSVPQSRFRKVAKMLDISNLKIKANLRACMIIPDTYYGIHLVFKFCDPRKLSKKPMYVNLKYRMGNGILHSYFATWRDDEWMMIELFRFFNDHVEYIYPILLESFSRCYCGNEAIYVKGIECRAIDKVKYEEFKRLTDSNTVLISNATMDDQIQELPSEVEEEFMISETDDDCVKVFLVSQLKFFFF